MVPRRRNGANKPHDGTIELHNNCIDLYTVSKIHTDHHVSICQNLWHFINSYLVNIKQKHSSLYRGEANEVKRQ